MHYGIASVRSQGDGFFQLDNLVEKPTPGEAPSRLAVAARYVFKPVIFDYLARTGAGKGNEIQLTDAVSSLIRDGGKVLGVTLPENERRFDIGNFPSYFRAFFEFALEDPQYGDELKAFVQEKFGDAACKS